MMEKYARLVRVGSAPAFTISNITYKEVVYAPAEMADTLPLFLLYSPICTLCYRATLPLTLADGGAGKQSGLSNKEMPPTFPLQGGEIAKPYHLYSWCRHRV
jgi:hypothetical protein